MKTKLRKYRHFLVMGIVVLTVLFANLWLTKEEAHGACVDVSCSSCGGDGSRAYCSYCQSYTKNGSSGATCGNCGIGKLSVQSCTVCGGDGKVAGDHSWSNTYRVSNATCTTQGEWRLKCSKCGQIGATPHYDDALGHITPTDYTYTTSNGITDGARYKNCSRSGCGTRLATQYGCWVYALDGISTVSGTNWYNAGANVTISATLSTGYKWSHWSWTGGGSSTTQTYSFKIDKAYQIYAHGQLLEYTIIYNANGGSGSMGDSGITQTGGALRNNTFTRTGYTFAGWNTMANGSGTSYINEAMIYPSANMTLYAQWTPNQYTITFVPNGGTFKKSDGNSIDSATMTYDATDNWDVSWGTVERKGYTFKGWYTTIEDGLQVYDENNETTNEGTYFQNNIWKYPDNLTLYARWEAIPRSVTYDANGGTTPNREFVKYYDEPLDLSLTAEKPGYIFVGWNTRPDATTGLSSIKMQEEDITLYAIYSIAVSDVANHSYDENGLHIYNQLKSEEVFLRVWELGNEQNYRDYPLEYEFDVSTMVYRYVIDVEVSDFISSISSYGYAVYAYDNAGNWTPVIADTPPPSPSVEYPQTVMHYRYDCIIEEYIHFATTVENVKAGERYKPHFLTEISGYQAERMVYPQGYIIAEDGTYLVTEAATTKAYYRPKEYKLTFDPNGGSTSVTEKTVYYGDYYRDMPTPVRAGHTFVGWFTEKNGGERVTSSDKYLLEADSTLYARWEINSYTVTYDYWTNGGTNVSAAQKTFNYGAQVDLSVTAEKSGPEKQNWNFVGWNTDASATTGLSSYIMTDSDITLYAIYQKDISVTLIEQTDTKTYQKTITKTIYNNETDAEFQIENSYGWNKWTLMGWTKATGADEISMYGNQGTYTFGDTITLYALYIRDITLSYDTNGASATIESQTKEAYYNAAGNSLYPSFVTASAPELAEHSFVNWKVDNGSVQDMMGSQKNSCAPEMNVKVLEDTLLAAIWDAYPEIEAYDRYFTLEQAQTGFITEDELLRKVKATDEEAKSASNPEGILENHRDVIVIDFTDSVFSSLISDSEVQVAYKATDGFGNIVTKTVMVMVTDTVLQESPKKSYVRFISRQFFADEEGNLISEINGGLEETSIWRRNAVYRNLLQNILNRTSTDIETWTFTRKEIEEMKKKL